MRDFINNIQVKKAITPVVVTDNTAQVSSIIDTQGYDSAAFLIALGTLSDSDTTAVVLLEEGDNSALSDNTAVADADMVSQSSSTTPELAAGFQFDDDTEIRKIGYLGTKRYIRLTVTPSGNTGNIPICAIAVLANPNIKPVTQAAS
jgi:hypothetical protein